MLSVGLAFLLDYLDDMIESEDDVSRDLELPTLALITKINPDDLVDKKRNEIVTTTNLAKSITKSRPAKVGI